MRGITRIRNVSGAAGVLSSAWLTLVEVFRDPAALSVIWDEIPIETRSLDRAPETKSFDPAEQGRRVRTRDADSLVRKRPASVPPAFKFSVLIVLGLTVAAGVAQVAMASAWPEPTEIQKHAFETMETAWKMGFGALVGLIGGKAVR